ncbi:hypothetical protein [Metabacillus iocasae]|uniref:Uncharacterized protein n=1 Tax=Priestia iocasae TaxID=2291674 RepID=A0ABS2R0N0_9BACI|nr:hypothetical protein [Metabacillus iocasae]MBM7704772.1 hypothetical protein [Metabacillus iocasae]
MYNNEKEKTPLQKYSEEQRRQDLQLLSVNELEVENTTTEDDTTTSVDIVFVEGEGWKLDSEH